MLRTLIMAVARTDRGAVPVRLDAVESVTGHGPARAADHGAR